MITQCKDSLCTIGIVVALLVISYFVTKFLNSKERFSAEENEQKIAISKKISQYINENTNYVDYLAFLKNNSNVSYKLINQDTFYEMKVLAKMDKLSPETVYSYIKEEK